MADEKDILLHMIQEQWAQARQSELQRSVVSNILIVVSSAIIGFLAKSDLGREAIPLTVFLMILGSFGSVICAKFYERFYLHVSRVGRMMERLDELAPEAKINELEKIADERHNERFPNIRRIRLHWLWSGIHAAIAIAGLICTVKLISCGKLFN